MEDDSSLIEIGSEVWEFRKANGFSKKFPPEIQQKIAQLCASGVTAYALGKATGVQSHTGSYSIFHFAGDHIDNISRLTQMAFNHCQMAKPGQINFNVRP